MADTNRKPTPPFPYNQNTETITLPAEREKEILDLISVGHKVQAIRRVLHLTGAGLRISKHYVDELERTYGHCT